MCFPIALRLAISRSKGLSGTTPLTAVEELEAAFDLGGVFGAGESAARAARGGGYGGSAGRALELDAPERPQSSTCV